MGDRREAAGRGARATRAGGGDRARSGATSMSGRPFNARLTPSRSNRRTKPWLCAAAAIALSAFGDTAGPSASPADLSRRPVTPKRERQGLSASAKAEPLFVESAAATGLVFTHVNGANGKYYLPEMMGAGVALFDFDNDGDLDVFLVQSGSIDAGGSALSDCRLFRNDLTVSPNGTRTLHFTDVTKQAGIAVRGYGLGVAVGDYDNDGYQ